MNHIRIYCNGFMKPPRVYFVRALEWSRDCLEPFSQFTSKICSKVILCQNEIKFPLLSPYLVFAFTWTKKKNVPNMSTRQTTPSTCHGLAYCTGKSWMKLQKKSELKIHPCSQKIHQLQEENTFMDMSLQEKLSKLSENVRMS